MNMASALLGIGRHPRDRFAYSMKSSEGFTRLIPGLLDGHFWRVECLLLSLSLRTLPVGTGYAVWTGIGAGRHGNPGDRGAGRFPCAGEVFCIVLILAGVVGLKLVSGS